MIPNLFSKKPIPTELPNDMQKVVAMLKRSKSRKDCIRKAYDVLAGKYKGRRLNTYLLFHQLFMYDLEKLWKKSGFLHCTNMNYIMRILLIRSGFFKDEDIRFRYSLIWYISIHQYLEVKLGKGSSMYVDVWGADNCVELGDHARGFHKSR